MELVNFKEVTNAVRNGELDVVKRMLEKNPKLVERELNNSTLLHFAAERGHIEMVRYLVEKAPHMVTNSREDETTAFHLACRYNRLQVAKLLLEKEPLLVNYSKSDGSTALHLACYYGHLKIVRFLFETNPSIVEFVDMTGATALHLAAKRNQLPVVKFLVDNAPQIVNSTDNAGWNVMHHAASSGWPDVMDFLKEKHPQLAKVHSACAETPEDVASIFSYFNRRSIRTIAKELNAGNLGENTPTQTKSGGTDSEKLIDAVKNGDLDIVKGLLGSKPKLVEIVSTFNNSTLLHFAAEHGHLEISKYFLEKAPDLIKSLQRNECTAFHLACQNGHLDVAEFLLSKEPLLDSYVKIDGSTAMHLACLNGHLEIVKFLRKVKPSLVNFVDDTGETALHSAAKADHLEVVKFLIDKVPRIVSSTDENGWSALHFACRYGGPNVVKFLIEKHPQLLEVRDVSGQTARQVAAKCSPKSKYHAIAALLKAKNVNKKTTTKRKASLPVMDKEKKKSETRTASLGETTKTSEREASSSAENAMSLKGQLFVSYSTLVRQDAVHKLVNHLRDKEGYEVWIDRDSMNDDSSDAKVKAILQSQAVLCFFSQAFEKSLNCKREMEFALKKEKKIIPIRVEKNYQHSDSLQFAFYTYSPLDYFIDDQFPTAAAAVAKALNATT